MNSIYRVNVQDKVANTTDEMLIIADGTESAGFYALNGSIMECEENASYDFNIVSSEYVGELQS